LGLRISLAPLDGLAEVAEGAILLLLLAPVAVHERVARKVDDTPMLAWGSMLKSQFLRFLQIFSEKMAIFFLKKHNAMIRILRKLEIFCTKTHIFAYFLAKIFY
jgi:hypothetical protein